jgi:hypothetical protein
MAKLSDVPSGHRPIAERFAHLADLTPAECAHRAAVIARLEERCPPSGEIRDLTHTYTSKLAAALPVHIFLAQLNHLNEMAARMPATGVDSPAADFRRAAGRLREENWYPNGLVRACEQWLAGHQDPDIYPECDIRAVVSAMEEK